MSQCRMGRPRLFHKLHQANLARFVAVLRRRVMLRHYARTCWQHCFFFQAEDGIRDVAVTGVQTCALPIFDHEWLVKFIEHRVADRRVVRLIQKWLNAGVLEDGTRTWSDKGTPQGGSISPLLANVYLHYAFDLWVRRWRKTQAHGDMIVVRCADDFIVGFQYREEAERFLTELRERLAKFGLELHPEKTRLLEFGAFAAEDRRRADEGEPAA